MQAVSFSSVSIADLASAIANCPGFIFLTDLPSPAPLDAIQGTFDALTHSDVGTLLNAAYTKNLVYKDSFGSGKGGSQVDMKRVLDLSPERLEQIKLAAPELASMQDEKVSEMLAFWESCSYNLMPKIVEALSRAIGSDVGADAHCNYRMVDYYERPANEAPPRCGEHRDFGTATLIFSSDVSGLQMQVDGTWQPMPPQPAGSAVLLFGWCTQIRSNGRIPAVLHRVVDAAPVDGKVPRRTSAVFFIAPKDVETPLEPVVLEGEARQYISGVKVGQLRGGMARKWRHREGTLSAEDRELEEEEIRVTKMATQDDVVRRLISAPTH